MSDGFQEEADKVKVVSAARARKNAAQNEASRLRRERRLFLSEKKILTDEEREWLERENIKEKIKTEKRLISYHKNKEKHKEKERFRVREYRASQTKEQKATSNRRGHAKAKQRCASDPAFACLRRARFRMKVALNGAKKKALEGCKDRFRAYFGCNKETLVSHVESQFRDGMTWENRGQVWELDHIVPLSAGLGNTDLLTRMNHYRNLQPLTVEENRRKGSSMPKVWPEGVSFTYEEVVASYEKYLSEKVKAQPKVAKKTKAVSVSQEG